MKENMEIGMEEVDRMTPYKTDEEIGMEMFRFRTIQQNLAKKLGSDDPDVLEFDTMIRNMAITARKAQGLDNPNQN